MTLTLIETLAGLQPGSPLLAATGLRADARREAERAGALLLAPSAPGPVTLAERHAVAAFVAGLYAEPASAAHYMRLLSSSAPDLAPVIAGLITPVSGPHGRFPAGPLSAEDSPVTPWTVPEGILPQRLSAALVHAHMLTIHPRDAQGTHLAALLEAGWDEDGIVVLSQLVSFVSFQIRVIAGLAALARRRTNHPEVTA